MLLLLTFTIQAQRNCSAMDVLQQQIQEDPSIQDRMDVIESHTQKVITKEIESGEQRVNGVITIPVVVHVIYSSSSENISEAQVLSQMQVLNDDFRRTNSDANSNWSQAADTQIEFCLATVDPSGNATNGITRKSSSTSEWGTNDAMKKAAQGGVNPWDTDSYLNMWVCNIGGGILGYAQFPGGAASTDGVVMSPQYFGTVGSAQAPFDGGRTATHEVGHWLNLRHIWGDGNCNADDFVTDTPTSDAANYGCASNHSSCSSLDMVQNYMDYSDDACMNLYTQGQTDRMRALFATGGFRAALLNSTACGSTPPPTASCSDGIQNQGETGVDCGGPCTACSSSCTGTEVTISLTFDQYPAETSWSIVNASGATVASGNGYSTANSSVTVTECLAAGCYDFVINDTYGDGICCSYGNGSYALTGEGNSLASGGSFASSETTNFCVGSTPPPASCDTPTGLGVTGVTEIDATLTWGAVSGAASYTVVIYQGGSSIYTTTATGTSLAITGFAAGTTYEFSVQADCGDATSGTSGAYSFTTESGSTGGGGCSYIAIDSESFESGWGIWNDGGSDSYRINSATYTNSGTRSIRLRDNTNSSVMTTDNLNLTGYEELTVDFAYYANSMENAEDFWLQVSTDGGSTYTTVQSWARGTNFNNNTHYTESVTVTGTFTSTTKVRFRCDASANADQVYIDNVVLSGCANGARTKELTKVEDTMVEDTVNPMASARIAQDATMKVYPNPATSQLNVNYQFAEAAEGQLAIMDVSGRMVQTQDLQIEAGAQTLTLDVSHLNAGIYFVNIVTAQQRLVQKLMIVE